MADATWLADVLRSAGLSVAEVDGWQTRRRPGKPSTLQPGGIVGHHTAGPAAGNMPSLGILINGRAGLAGPLSQLGLGRDGTYYCVAAGPANHAGPGGWQGLSGNYRVIGIEAENTGVGEEWPAAQIEAYLTGSAAILRHLGLGAEWWCAHREWTPTKIDPTGIDADWFRGELSARLGQAAPPPPAPQPEPAPTPSAPPFPLPAGSFFGPKEWGNESVSGYYSHREDLRMWQQRMKDRGWRITADGLYGDETGDVAEAFQREKGLRVDRLIGQDTWGAAWTAPIT